MTFDQPPSSEGTPKIEKAKVLEMIRTKGLQDPETMDLIHAWTLEQEQQVALENTPTATLRFDLERVDLYLAAGDVEGALEFLENPETGLFYAALQQGDQEICSLVEVKIKEIRG
jgi:rhamnogalacturonyl hydrolase YesR